jgi:hypothetical protein
MRFLGPLALLALGACEGEIGDGPKPPDDVGINGTDLFPAEPAMHRLTVAQLHNTYSDLLGDPLVLPTDLPADDLLYGFTSISAAGATISSLDAEKYEAAAYDVLDQVWADPARRDALVGCVPESASDPCVHDFMAEFTKKAWRRPVEAAEVVALVGLGQSIADSLGDTQAGIKHALAAVLQSPHFLFRVEIGEPDPENPKFLRYTSWEMASRLSFLITDAPPDQLLTFAAETGALSSRENVQIEAERLLADPRARPALVRFFQDFMNIRKLDTLDKNPERFPAFSATIGPAMRVEIERMFENVVFERQGDFRQMFTTRDTYVNEELATVYGIEGITGSDFVPYTFPEGVPRAGLLTTPGFLAVNAHKTQTSPTHRGRFVRLNLLCQDVPPPPPGVDTSLPESTPGEQQTLRQKLERHREDDACRSCHALMDPIGFAFENFDAIGSYRTADENGLSIDATTELDGQAVAGPIEMGQLVAELPDVGACIARRFYEHAGAHLAEPEEEVAVEKLVEGFVASNHDFKALVVALVTNDGFRYATPAEGSPGAAGQ